MGGLFKAPKIPEQKQQVVEPVSPVQEASLEIEADDFDSEGKKKKKTGKGELKIPLSPSTGDTGLKV